MIETIVLVVELDLSTATVQDMNDARKCSYCRIGENMLRYFRTSFLAGRFSRHVETFLSSVDILLIYHDIRPVGKIVWDCARCHDLPIEHLGGYGGTEPWEVIDRVMIAHKIQELKLDQDYHVAYGTPASAQEGQMETMHVALGDLTANEYLCDMLDSNRGIWRKLDSSSDAKSDSEVDADSDG